MSYDTMEFYNSAVAIVAGSGAAALVFRLIPPLAPAFRTRRLMALILRDLRRLATRPISEASSDWASRIHGRLLALPDEAQPLQRSELLAALSFGLEVIELRGIAFQPDQAQERDAALDAIAQGRGARAITHLTNLDDALAPHPRVDALKARSSILAVSEALSRHAAYFNAGVRSEVY